jgi:hypothetical protein
MDLKTGELVTITVKNPVWPMRKAYASYVHIPEFNTYTGRVVRNHKAIREGQIGITADEGKFDLRVIDLNRIVGYDGPAVAETPSNEHKVWTVKGSKGNEYVVTYDAGRYHCSCPGFSFRGACKHVDEKRAEVGAGKS